eukprot:COSAG01_NODE_425_length_17240_cov_29.899306_2_plen_132_part_00
MVAVGAATPTVGTRSFVITTPPLGCSFQVAPAGVLVSVARAQSATPPGETQGETRAGSAPSQRTARPPKRSRWDVTGRRFAMEVTSSSEGEQEDEDMGIYRPWVAVSVFGDPAPSCSRGMETAHGHPKEFG